MSHAGHHLAVINLGIRWTLDSQDTGQSPLYPHNRVIEESVIAGHLRRDLGNDGAAGKSLRSMRMQVEFYNLLPDL
jgi:hypothetical protein